MVVIQFVDNQFLRSVIGRLDAVKWPLQFPDINPTNFFLWGYLKNRVYNNHAENLDEFKRISSEVAVVTYIEEHTKIYDPLRYY